jgi:probable O-glycosylation ligase (exosortase A-associated)
VRDALLMLIIVGGALAALRVPWVGVIMWTWVSLMNPHEAFGYAVATWPVASMVALATLLGLLFTRDRQSPFVGPPIVALVCFWIWICVTLPFSFYLDDSLPIWERSMKIFLMLFVTLALITDEKKLHVFIWTMVVSVAFFGVKGGVFTLATGGNYLVWGPGGFIGGNNEVGLALVTIIPMMRYLHLRLTAWWARHAMALSMLLCVVTVLGTHSRGALVGLGAMALLLWWKGGNKVRWAVIGVMVGAATTAFMPQAWWDRMETIQTYESDGSAMGRINAWWNAWNLANDNFFGGGFRIYTREVFARYAPVPDDVHAAHSIFFEVMGEHGFVGLFLFLSIGVLTWLTAGRLIKVGQSAVQLQWAADLGAMVQVSQVGYAVAGAFLSLAYYDLPYDIMAVAVLALHFATRRAAQSIRGGQERAAAPDLRVAQVAEEVARHQPKLRWATHNHLSRKSAF